MPVETVVRPNYYQDSVALMRMASDVQAIAGVRQASALMGTDANKAVLEDAGLLTPTAGRAGANDMVLVVDAETDAALQEALGAAEELLERARPTEARPAERPPRTIEQGRARLPEANLLLVSVAGEYADAEALKGLRAGLHVFLFSSNVPIEREVLLKRLARERGLLMMGPDCGTTILAGVPLGFANAVARGRVGVLGPSGTGIQQVTVLLDRHGVGVSHAIGTGTRDLSDAVGGSTALQALDVLARDPATEVVTVVAKPSSAAVAQRVLDRCRDLGKPVVVNFLGLGDEDVDWRGVATAQTLEEAAALAAAAATAGAPEAFLARPETLRALAEDLSAGMRPEQRFVRGLFSGGSLCSEGLVILGAMGLRAYSNVAAAPERRLPDADVSREHTCVDMGTDEFTTGRPHPMIDFRLRRDRIRQEARDPSVAVLLLDVVLGYGANPDPAAELAPVVREAREEAEREGRGLAVIGSVCGTDADPQGRSAQEARLESAGMVLLPSNAQATRVAAMVAQRRTSG